MAVKTRPQRESFEDWDELRFVRNGRTGTVHVVVPATRGHVERSVTLGESSGGALAELMGSLGQLPALCGFTANITTNLPDGDEPISIFDDEDLCGACHRALGPLAHRAFEHSTVNEEA